MTDVVGVTIVGYLQLYNMTANHRSDPQFMMPEIVVTRPRTKRPIMLPDLTAILADLLQQLDLDIAFSDSGSVVRITLCS